MHSSRIFLPQLSNLNEEQNLIDAIKLNIENLLNSRVNDAPACPTFGLSSFNLPAITFKENIDQFIRQLELKLICFEPRLNNIKIKYLGISFSRASLNFLVTADFFEQAIFINLYKKSVVK